VAPTVNPENGMSDSRCVDNWLGTAESDFKMSHYPVPGPLFTFAAYLGTVMGPAPTGWLGGAICLAAIFLPSFFLAIGPLPFWNWFRQHPAMRSVLKGVNAAVVGLLLAALYNPVWISAIHAPADFAIGIIAFLLLTLWAVPPWLVVVIGALGATALAQVVS
jgi:chromate transporter